MDSDYEQLKAYFQNKVENVNAIKNQIDEILAQNSDDIKILLRDVDKYKNAGYFEFAKHKIQEIQQKNPHNAQILVKFLTLTGDMSKKLNDIANEITNTRPELLKEFFPQEKGIKTKGGGNQMLKNKTINIKFEIVDTKSQNETKSLTLNNSHERKDPNDKTMHKFFNPLPAQFEKQKMELLVGTVKKGKDKGNDIIVNVDWDFSPKFLAMNPQIEKFDAWDKVVIKTCISEHATHARGDYSKLYQTTLDSLYRAMIGDDGTTGKRKILTPKMKKDMLQSITKAANCRIQIDLTDACEKIGYNDGKPSILSGNLLEVQVLDGIIVNGKPTTVLSFGNVSPLQRAAEIQNNQILTYDKNLLALPAKNKNRDSIVICDYFLCRLLEIKSHKMTPTIKLDTAFSILGFTDISKDKRKQLLEHIESYFEYWLEQGEIKSYFFVDRNGQEIKGAKWRTVEREATDGTTHEVSEIYRPKARRTTLGFYAVTFTY